MYLQIQLWSGFYLFWVLSSARLRHLLEQSALFSVQIDRREVCLFVYGMEEGWAGGIQQHQPNDNLTFCPFSSSFSPHFCFSFPVHQLCWKQSSLSQLVSNKRSPFITMCSPSPRLSSAVQASCVLWQIWLLFILQHFRGREPKKKLNYECPVSIYGKEAGWLSTNTSSKTYSWIWGNRKAWRNVFNNLLS